MRAADVSVRPRSRFLGLVVGTAVTAIVASGLVASPAFAATAVVVNNLDELKQALSTATSSSSLSITLGSDITDMPNASINVPTSTNVSLNLSGFSVTLTNVVVNASARFTVTDTAATGGTFTADASTSSNPGLAGFQTTGATLIVDGNVHVVAAGGPHSAAIGGMSGGDAGNTVIMGSAVVSATAGTGAAAIGAGETGAAGGSMKMTGNPLVTVYSSISNPDVIGSQSSVGTVSIGGGILVIPKDYRWSLVVPDTASIQTSGTGTIQADGAIDGVGPIINHGYITGSGSIDSATQIQGANYLVTLDTSGGMLTPSQAPFKLQGSTFAGAGRTLPTPTRDGYVFIGWQTSTGIAVVNTTNLSGIYPSSTDGKPVAFTLTAAWRLAASISLSSDKDQVTAGTNPTLTATVAPSASVTGAVEFFANGLSLGSKNLQGGTATLKSTVFLPVSSTPYAITARYSGDSTYNAATSAASSLTVVKGVSSISVALPSDPNYAGQLVLSATLDNANETGAVTFYNGSTKLDVATSTGLTRTLKVTLPVGVYSINAVYGGDDNFTDANSNTQPLTVIAAPTATPTPTPTVTVTATPAPTTSANGTNGTNGTNGANGTNTISAPAATTTAIWLPVTSTSYGATAAVRVHVGANVSGTVTFFDGGTALGSAPIVNGYATLLLPSTLKVGSHGITAAYSGDGANASSASSATMLTVTKAITKVKVKAKKFARGTKPKVTVTIGKLANGGIVKGKVRLYVGKVKVKTFSIKKAKKTVALSKKYSASLKISAVFVGSKTVLKMTSKAVTVKVK